MFNLILRQGYLLFKNYNVLQQRPGSRHTIVLVNNADHNEKIVNSVIEFLTNEHFQVIGVSLETGHSGQAPAVGDCFRFYPVHVASTHYGTDPISRWAICRSLGIQQESVGGGPQAPVIDWIEFHGKSTTASDLDRLLADVTRSCLRPAQIAEVRDSIVSQTPRLLQRTIERYESNGFLERYSEKWTERLPVEQLRDFLLRMPEDAKILDAGCGPAHHSRFIASCGHRVVALDVTMAAMQFAARQRQSQIWPVRSDINCLPFKQNVFDGIWCCATLVHFPIETIVRALKELRRTLQLGGVLSFSVSMGKLPAVDPDGRFFDSFVDEAEVRSVCSAARLELLSMTLETSKRTTTGGLQLARWLTVVTRRAG